MLTLTGALARNVKDAAAIFLVAAPGRLVVTVATGSAPIAGAILSAAAHFASTTTRGTTPAGTLHRPDPTLMKHTGELCL